MKLERFKSGQIALPPEEFGGGISTRADVAVFVLILVVPMASMLAFGAVDMWAFSMLAIFAAVVASLWFIDAIRTGSFRFSSDSLQVPLLAMIGLGLVQLLPLGGDGGASALLSVPSASALSLDPYSTRIFVIRLVIYFIFFAAALQFVNSAGRIRKIVVAVLIYGALMAFFGILQKLADPGAIYGVRPTPQAISFGPLVNQHHFAAFMELISGLALGLLFGGGVKRDKRPVLMIAVVLSVLALFFTGSRGGILSFAGVALFAIAATRITTKKSAVAGEMPGSSGKLSVLAGAAAFLIVVIGLALYLGAENSMIRGFGLSSGGEDITSGRAHFWRVALDIFLANPIIGAGFDAFGVAFTRFDTRNGFYRVEQAHNDYLQMLADGGVIGFLIIVGFIVLLFRRGLRAISERRDAFTRSAAIGAMAGCFGILIHSFFDFPLRTPANAFFFLLLAAVAVVTTNDSNPVEDISGLERPLTRIT